MAYSRVRTQRVFPLYEVWGFPIRGRVLTPERPPPPGSAPAEITGLSGHPHRLEITLSVVSPLLSIMSFSWCRVNINIAGTFVLFLIFSYDTVSL